MIKLLSTPVASTADTESSIAEGQDGSPEGETEGLPAEVFAAEIVDVLANADIKGGALKKPLYQGIEEGCILGALDPFGVRVIRSQTISHRIDELFPVGTHDLHVTDPVILEDLNGKLALLNKKRISDTQQAMILGRLYVSDEILEDLIKDMQDSRDEGVLDLLHSYTPIKDREVWVTRDGEYVLEITTQLKPKSDIVEGA